jgi:hypothetical protein
MNDGFVKRWTRTSSASSESKRVVGLGRVEHGPQLRSTSSADLTPSQPLLTSARVSGFEVQAGRFAPGHASISLPQEIPPGVCPALRVANPRALDTLWGVC